MGELEGRKSPLEPGMRLCAVSVDLDEIPNYYAIHGLPEPTGPERSLVYDVAVERLRALGSELGVPLTFFAIGADLQRREAAARLAEAARGGIEIANHTLDHRYDLVRLGRDEIRRQVEGGADAIERVTGERPVGFRAPGYTITDEVFDVLRDAGVTYDSSVFPCPGYWAAKAAAIGIIAARGRASRSIVDSPFVLLAPPRPYRVGRPYWRRGDGLVELPVQVTRGPRVHFIGTTVTAVAGPRGAALLCADVRGRAARHAGAARDRRAGRGRRAAGAAAAPARRARHVLARRLASLRAAIATLRTGGVTPSLTMRQGAEQRSLARWRDPEPGRT